MDDEIDVMIADRDDAVPMDFLDEIVAEYQRSVIFDGQQLLATGG